MVFSLIIHSNYTLISYFFVGYLRNNNCDPHILFHAIKVFLLQLNEDYLNNKSDHYFFDVVSHSKKIVT